MPYLTNIKEFILDILFPQICLSCQTSLKSEEKSDGLCAFCLSKIILHTTLFCGKCRARLPDNTKICHKDSAYLLGATTNYEDQIKSLIHGFKYKSWSRLQGPIKKLIIKYLQNLNLEFKNYIIIPIPLHKKRQQERGFNQAILIAKIVSIELKLPLEQSVLMRIKETKSQAKIKDWDQKKENLDNAFDLKAPEKIKDKNIILVDDVYTSGATINEATKILKANGAKKILAFVIAKAR
ncbi:MAG: ComF family protein [bacterium]|nr:ComF family protein [bacterium]